MRTRSIKTGLIVVGFVALALGASAFAQGTSAVGTWKLNLAKSKHNPGPAPKSAVLKIEAAGMGATVTGDVVAADGSAQHWSYTGDYGGKDVPVTGNNPNADMASRKRISPTTIETTYKKGGKVTTVNTSVVSADGKTLTVTTKGSNAQGVATNNLQVYDKQ